MIHGQNKASAYGVHFTGDGYKIEEEFRQCCHCQYVWVYKPGSGTRRGYCLKHNGWLCGRDQCINQQKDTVAQYEQVTGKSVSCLAAEELNDFLANRAAKQAGIEGINFVMSPIGIIIPLEEKHG